MNTQIENPLLVRLYYLFARNINRLFSLYFYLNYIKWRQIKGNYKGQRVFLIGNGPSLNKTPLYLLKNEYTIAFNRFGLMLERLDWHPSFYMVNDALVAEDTKRDIERMINGAKLAFFPDQDKLDHVNFRKFIPHDDKVFFVHEEPVVFSNHLPFVGTGGTVIYSAFQILKHLGFSDIHILGVDVNYIIHSNTTILGGKHVQSIQSNADDDPNHFDPRYFGKGKKYHQPDQTTVNRIIESLKIVAQKLPDKNISVTNIGYDSSIDFFEKKDFEEALGYDTDKISHLFGELIKRYGYHSIDSFYKDCDFCNSTSSWKNKSKIVVMPTEIAYPIIKDKILEYIPLGPFQNNIFFLRR